MIDFCGMAMRRWCAGLCVLVSCVALVQAQPQTREPWKWQNPLPQGNGLTNITVFTPEIAVAVGGFGTMLRSTDGGKSWYELERITEEHLYAVASHEALGFATGYNGIVLRSTNYGATWQVLDRPPVLNQSLFCVEVFANGIAVVAGLNICMRTVDSGSTFTNSEDGSIMLFRSMSFDDDLHGVALSGFGFAFTTDGGIHWQNRLAPFEPKFNSIRLVQPEVAIIASDDGTIYKTIDDGLEWTLLHTEANTPFYEIEFVDRDHGIVTGKDGVIMHTTDGGTSWTKSYLPMGEFIGGIDVGADGKLFIAGGFAGLLTSIDTGKTWSNFTTGNHADLTSVAFADRYNGVAVGGSGVVLRTSDASSWSPAQSNTNSNLYDVAFNSARQGIAVGDSGTVIRTTDAGVTWTPVSTPTLKPLFRLAYLDSNVVMTVGGGGTIMRSTDAGATWLLLPVLENAENAVIQDVVFIDSTTGIAVAHEFVFKSTDAGATWKSIAKKPMRYAYRILPAFNDTLLSMASNGFLYLSTDGGYRWDTLFNHNRGLRGFHRTADGVISIVTSEGACFRSIDKGTTWSEHQTPSYSGLADVVFFHADTGIVVGRYGAILGTTTGFRPTVISNVEILPGEFMHLSTADNSSLGQLFPNPASDCITVPVRVHRQGAVRLEIYDAANRSVGIVLHQAMQLGTYNVNFSTTDIPSGTYTCRLFLHNQCEYRTLVVQR